MWEQCWLFRSQPAERTAVTMVWWNIPHKRRDEEGGCRWEDAGLLWVAVTHCLLRGCALSLRYLAGWINWCSRETREPMVEIVAALAALDS